MKGKVYLVTNGDAIEKADALGIPIPEAEEHLFPFYFNIIDVSAIYKYDEYRMVIFMAGQSFALEYDEDKFNRIINFIDE